MRKLVLLSLGLTSLVSMIIMVLPSAFASHSVDPDACYNDGFYDGENNPFSQELYEFCEQYGDEYYDGFIDGCMSADNSREVCEQATDS
jgi:hypothetical protein